MAIVTSATSDAAASPRWPESAPDTAASAATVAVGPFSCERCRSSVRTERAPVGRALVDSAGCGPIAGGSSPARVSRTCWRWARAASMARHGRKPGDAGATSGTGVARPNSQAAIAKARGPSRQRVRELHDRDRARAGAARNAAHRREDVHAPRRPADVQLVIGEPGHGVQAAVPAVVVEVVAHDLVGLDGRRHPARIGQRRSVLDADRQCADRLAPWRAPRRRRARNPLAHRRMRRA